MKSLVTKKQGATEQKAGTKGLRDEGIAGPTGLRGWQTWAGSLDWKVMTGNLFENEDDLGAGAAGSWYTAYCDGGARGNPGPAGYGAVVEDPQGQIVARLSEFLGKQTNNYAEYSGLLAVLEWALKNGAKRLCVVSDSELMVRQMKGQYKVKNAGLRPLWEEAQRRTARLEHFEMRHTLRGGNKEADRLANEAMDRGQGKKQGTGIREQKAIKGYRYSAPHPPQQIRRGAPD
jgi:ribonuclease HI